MKHPMSDRLRGVVLDFAAYEEGEQAIIYNEDDQFVLAAADELDRLHAEVERLRADSLPWRGAWLTTKADEQRAWMTAWDAEWRAQEAQRC